MVIGNVWKKFGTGHWKSKYCEGQGSAKEYLARSSIERTPKLLK